MDVGVTATPPRDRAPVVSAQCPACGLHELVLVQLQRDAAGRWKQVADGKPGAAADVVQIDACPVCSGAWFDAGELDLLAGEATRLETLLAPDSAPSTRPCPHGHGLLREHRLPGRSPTPLDRCPTCHGLWLDGDERRKLARATTKEGQETQKEQLLKRGAIWAAQLLTQLPVEVENPARGTPIIVFGLLVLLVAMFLLQIEGFVDTYALGIVAGRFVRQPDTHTLVTHQFLHGSWVHLLGNAYFLYTFGDNVEHIFGRGRFIAFFLLAGAAGGAAHVLLTHATALPVVGASGAIAGVLGAYLWIFPRAKLFHVILFIPLKVPVWAYLVVWLLFHVGMAFFTTKEEVAWFAHLGGLVCGLALTPLFLAVRRRQVARSVRVPARARD